MGSEDGNSHLVSYAGEVLEPCEIRRVIDRAPRVAIAGISTASMFNEKAQVDLLSLGDLFAPHAMDMFCKFSLLLAVQPENRQEVRDIFRGGW